MRWRQRVSSKMCTALGSQRSSHRRWLPRAAAILGLAVLMTAAPGLSSAAGDVVNVNEASVEELLSLPGIGESKATAIVVEREKRPFSSLEDLERVSGIGAATVSDLRPLATVGSGR